MEKKKVIEALYLVLGQDHRAASGPPPDRRWHGKGHRGRVYKVSEEYMDEELYGADDYEASEAWDESGYYEWDYSPSHHEEADYHEDPDAFDSGAAYYQYDEEYAEEQPWHDVEQYDQAYAAYLDARKRFNELKVSRGYLPVVALTDPAAGNVSPGVLSPSSAGSSNKGKKGKAKGTLTKGKPSSTYKYTKSPPKGADPRGRAKATLTCLRCGQPGHFAANCPVPSKGGVKRPAVESVALAEIAHVTFQDAQGHERTDVAMLDPGASAFLSGFGPIRRYLTYLQSQGYPVDDIKFNRCMHKFHFGGDGESWSHWVVQLPMCLDGRLGSAQVFLLAGETPLLCGRPIIEALGLSMDFASRAIRFHDGAWQAATIGLHGEYLLPLWNPEQPILDFGSLDFDLRLAPDGEVDPQCITFRQFTSEETAFSTMDFEETPLDFGEQVLRPHQLQTFEQCILEDHNNYHGYVTQELHSSPKPRMIWEVYTSHGRLSSVAAALGAQVEVFGYDTGWDFDEPSHQKIFLERLEAECPDELFLSPSCGPWSTMQNLTARTEDQQHQLQELREWHHSRHLQFVKKAYLTQVRQGGHAHVEQPAHALSWKTSALVKLPGYHCVFDQCRFGCGCQTDEGDWLLVKKPTALQTTKLAVFKEFHQVRCTGDHQHCPLEGSAAGLGRRTRYLESYQPGLASVLAAALMIDEPPSISDFAGAVGEDRQHVGALIKLMTTNRVEAVRTVQRLHRNLGHPSAASLVELLESRGASEEVMEAARTYHCAACERYRKPNQPSPASPPSTLTFNQEVQADVMWLKIAHKKYPLLHMVDVATKYQSAALLHGERTEDYCKALERHWFRHFGTPTVLITDEGRGWASDEMEDFFADHNIRHVVAPGEAHTRLGAVERRHAILRKSIEIYMTDRSLTSRDGLREAMAYVLPQVNSAPTVAGYSPSQWVLGFQPNFPGDLLGDGLNPAHLGGSETFEALLQRRTAAKMALAKADQDQRLRRALLRKYSGTNAPLQSGQVCWYWRDARASDLVKIRWKGPARMILREDDDEGKPMTYWIAHGTQLLRCAPHHVRAGFQQAGATVIGGLEEARRSVVELKSRGVTRFIDLARANKRQIEDIQSDDEAMDDDLDGPPRQRPRLDLPGVSGPRTPSPVPEPFLDLDIPDVSPTPTTPLPDSDGGQPIPVDDDDQASTPLAAPPPLPAVPELPMNENDEPEPSGEPSVPPSTRSLGPPPALDAETAALYEPAGPEEFSQRRLRYDQQETMMFGPAARRIQRPSPYSGQRSNDPFAPIAPPPQFPPGDDAPPPEGFSPAFAVEDLETMQLPSGWRMDSDGYMCLTDQVADFWEVRAGCLIRHHVSPRHSTIDVKEYQDSPVDPQHLDPIRVTVMKFGDGSVEIKNDDGSSKLSTQQSWVGHTIYQLNGIIRKELCMYSNLTARKLARDTKTKINRQTKKQAKKVVLERDLTVDERAQFQQAKCKELQSFFENDVWTFDVESNADPARTLTARMLLSWGKQPDGSPRAKARLIVRGYADVDALHGNLETSSPTTSRLSRCWLLSLASNMGWLLWTADVSTAFLQGRPQERLLWIKLPADALRLLGAPPETRMKLQKPCYGQLDAPRRWYLEAVRRLQSLGLRQHALDPCAFLIYEQDFKDKFGSSETPSNSLGEHGLVGMIILHVDDMLGCGDATSMVYQGVIQELRKTFSFREWQDGDSLEYCGASIHKDAGGIRVGHQAYLKKIKPMTLPKHVGPDHELSQRELTELRGLLGSLQWPAVQSSPHLQASTSMTSGSVATGRAQAVMDANRLLKFAKENADVGLSYPPLGPVENLRMITAFDASFCSRPDGSSQGGFFVLLAPRHILETKEDVYHILDWRSTKLPRVARSSLSAEAQAAGVAPDATEFACRFYEHLLHPLVPLAQLLQMKSSLEPVMITDAKAVFDSYHREALVSNVTDRRSSLEIRVVKEQFQALGGTLRWVSSDRQLADGLTKASMRQNLADKLRHGQLKFLYDPDYVAAKKKTVAERKLEFESSSKSRNLKKKKLAASEKRILDEEEQWPVPNDPPDEPPNEGEAYFAESENVLKYVNMIPTATLAGSLAVQHGALQCLSIFWLCLAASIPAAQGLVIESDEIVWGRFPEAIGLNMNQFWILMLCVISFCFGWYDGMRRQRATLGATARALTMEIDELRAAAVLATNRANGLSIVLQTNGVQLERVSADLQRATAAYQTAANAAREYQQALQLAVGDLDDGYQARVDLDDHSLVCAMGHPISIQDGTNVWHANEHCDQLYESGREIREVMPCERCSSNFRLPRE